MKKMMLKTTFVALSALFAFSANSLAAEPVEGKEYKVVFNIIFFIVDP